MKFDCDKGKRRREARFHRTLKWHKWFAWYPVRIGAGDCRWLETVERKLTCFYGSVRWSYRPLVEVDG